MPRRPPVNLLGVHRIPASLAPWRQLAQTRQMAKVEKIERRAGFLSADSYEVKLSCGHKFSVEYQPSVRVGDDLKCPVC